MEKFYLNISKKDNGYTKVLIISTLGMLSCKLSILWLCYLQKFNFKSAREPQINRIHLHTPLRTGSKKHLSLERPAFGWNAIEKDEHILLESRAQFNLTS